MPYKLTEQDEWRSKYYEALRGFEQESRQVRSQLQALYGLVGKLCLAGQGQSPQLDLELRRLKDAAGKELPAEQLEPISEAVAAAVREMDRREPAVPAAPAAEVPPTPVATEEGGALIRAEMSRLLDEIARDQHLAPVAKVLEDDLFSPMMGDQLPKLVEKISGLTIEYITRLEKSRHEIELLLGQMMAQLDSLNQYILNQTTEETQRTQSTHTLNNQITGEMEAIGESVERGGADLEALRQQLRARLDSISQHLQSYRQRETEFARQSRERSEVMRARMDEMESEARRLQAKLSSEKRLALLDAVTKIPNRLAWDHRFAAECERWKRFRQPVCVAAWDVDKFKSVNDGFGHRAGDRVLKVVAETLADSIRATDFVARYGGEEFAMLLPGTTLDDAVRLAEKVRVAIAEIGFHFRGTPVCVTISCGITQMRKDDSGDSAFVRADKALYQAKESGRNRVISA